MFWQLVYNTLLIKKIPVVLAALKNINCEWHNSTNGTRIFSYNEVFTNDGNETVNASQALETFMKTIDFEFHSDVKGTKVKFTQKHFPMSPNETHLIMNDQMKYLKTISNKLSLLLEFFILFAGGKHKEAKNKVFNAEVSEPNTGKNKTHITTLYKKLFSMVKPIIMKEKGDLNYTGIHLANNTNDNKTTEDRKGYTLDFDSRL